jgi:hypothetical protein
MIKESFTFVCCIWRSETGDRDVRRAEVQRSKGDEEKRNKGAGESRNG